MQQRVSTGGDGASPNRRRQPPAARRRARSPALRSAGRGPEELNLLEALSGAASDLHRSLSGDDVLRVASEQARAIVGATQAATSRTVGDDWSQRVTAIAAGTGGPRDDLLPPEAWPPYARVGRSNAAVRLNEAQLRRMDATGRPRHSWLGAPLVGLDGRNLGVLQVADRLDGEPFSPADEAVLVQLARMASVAIENAQLYESALDARTQLAWSAHIERVRAAELRAVIEAMGEAVLVCDGQGRVRLANPAADRLFEGRPVRTFDDLLSRFADDGPGGHGRTAARTGSRGTPDDPPGSDGPVEVRLIGRSERWLELRVYPVGGSPGRLGEPDEDAGQIAVMRDITRSRQARAQRDAFLGILSHELRTPITTIYAGSKVLSRTDPATGGEMRQELANDIAAEAERLFRLVEDLLVMTRVERGALQLATEPVLLQRVLASAIRLEAAHWPDARIRLRGRSDIPAVAGDPTYIEQVARNLLSNAAKYSPEGSVVDVRLEPAGDEVVVRVLDHGRGFGPGESEDLFELFYRSPATAAQASGAGIGLFVCRRLITAMGGRIWARPRRAGGAEFGFALRRYGEDD